MNEMEKGYMAGRMAGFRAGLVKGEASGSKRVAGVAHAMVGAIKSATKEKNSDALILIDVAMGILSREKEECGEDACWNLIEHDDHGSEGSMALFHWLCPMSNGDDCNTPSCVSGSGSSVCGYFGGLVTVDDEICVRCLREGRE